jgi:hypothetical protein
MAAQGATLQNYNNELVKCVDDLKEKREEINKAILKDVRPLHRRGGAVGTTALFATEILESGPSGGLSGWARTRPRAEVARSTGGRRGRPLRGSTGHGWAGSDYSPPPPFFMMTPRAASRCRRRRRTKSRTISAS